MGVRLSIAPSRVATKIKSRAITRELIRRHRTMHLERAEYLRAEADRIDGWISQHVNEMSVEQIQEAEVTAINMRTQAIAEENGECMDVSHG